MRLNQILATAEVLEHEGPDVEVAGIALDSRKVTAGSLFAAVKGTQVDGHDYIKSAIARGATAILCETWPEQRDASVAWLRVANSAISLGNAAAMFFGNPSSKVDVVGITGTNGKTTVATLLHQAWTAMGRKAGLISTIQNQIGERRLPSTHTTPDAVALQQLFSQMVDEGCTHVAMEISSHAIQQHRIAGLDVDVAVFTNISRDHLDYHGDFRNYIHAKKALFDQLRPSAMAVINADDRNAEVMVQNTKATVRRFSLAKVADHRARVLESGFEGLSLKLDGHEIHSPLVGRFNASNLLAAYAAMRATGDQPADILPALSQATGANGRFDCFQSPKSGVIAIVDYAHTPDALENVLETIRSVRRREQRVFTVVGCGGDRDKGKRPLMAAVAARLSDHLILTSDNPRTEEPQAILADMKSGLSEEQHAITLTIPDRAEGIRTACMMAATGDIILIAGKGHETYQEINGQRHDFNDQVVAQNAFKSLKK